MPEQDTPSIGTEGNDKAKDEKTATEQSETEEVKPFLVIEGKDGGGHTYNTVDDAIKTFTEKEATITKQAQENAVLRQQLKQTEDLSKLAEVVAQQGAPVVETEEQRQGKIRQLVESVDSEGGGTAKMLEIIGDANFDTETRIKKEMQETIAQNQSKSDERYAQLEARLLDQDPDYVPIRDKVQDLEKKFGIDRPTAMAIHKAYSPEVEQPDRPPLPGNTSGNRVTGDPPEQYISDKEKQHFFDEGFTEEEVEQVEKQYKEKAVALAGG